MGQGDYKWQAVQGKGDNHSRKEKHCYLLLDRQREIVGKGGKEAWLRYLLSKEGSIAGT